MTPIKRNAGLCQRYGFVKILSNYKNERLLEPKSGIVIFERADVPINKLVGIYPRTQHQFVGSTRFRFEFLSRKLPCGCAGGGYRDSICLPAPKDTSPYPYSLKKNKSPQG